MEPKLRLVATAVQMKARPILHLVGNNGLLKKCLTRHSVIKFDGLLLGWPGLVGKHGAEDEN